MTERKSTHMTPLAAVLPSAMRQQQPAPLVPYTAPPTILDAIYARHRKPLVTSTDPNAVRYTCSVCGLQEPVLLRNGKYARCPCRCEKIAEDRCIAHELGKEVRRIQLAQLKADVYDWLGPQAEEVGLAGMSFANFEHHAQITSNQLTAHATCQTFAAHHIQGQHWLENLLIFGNQAGTGKTHLACAILNTVAEAGQICRFCTVQGFFDAQASDKFKRKDELVYQAQNAPLLVLDDLDKLYIRDGSTYHQDVLFELLDKRYKRGYPTIVTTNEEADFKRWFTRPVLSRLYERMTLLPMDGVDYRLLRAARNAGVSLWNATGQ
jgi:DNA replication protein DnaC